MTTVKGNAGGAQVDAPLFAYVRNGSGRRRWATGKVRPSCAAHRWCGECGGVRFAYLAQPSSGPFERTLTGQGLGARSKAWLGPTSRQFAALAFALFTTFLFDCRDVDPLFEKVGELAQIAV